MRIIGIRKIPRCSPSGRLLSRTLILLLMTLTALPGSGDQQGKPKKISRKTARLEARLQALMTEYTVLGMTCVVVRNNRIVYSGAYGYADVENKRPMTTDTVFRIASMSKPFAGTALMQLCERGKCHLDDDVSRHLGFTLRNPRHPGKVIRLRHLMTHTSGLTDHGGYNDFLKASYGDNPPPITEILVPGGRFFSRASWKTSPPGRKFEYSNLGCGVAATIVEKISVERYDRYCARHIFTPLGMTASLNPAEMPHPEKFAVLYDYLEDQDIFEPAIDNYSVHPPAKRPPPKHPPGYNGSIHSPQGGVRCSAPDLAKFMIAHMNDGQYGKVRILKKKTARLMRRVHWSGFQSGRLYRKTGLFLHITGKLIRKKTLAGHGGRAYGFLGLMYFDRKSRSGIIIFMNGGNFFRDEKGRRGRRKRMFHRIEERLYRTLYFSCIRDRL